MAIAAADRPADRPADDRRNDKRDLPLHTRGRSGGAWNLGDTDREIITNPNTSQQPTVGASLTPTEDRLAGLQVEQRHAYDSLTRSLLRMGPSLEEDHGDVLADLEATMTLLQAGGALAELDAGAATYETALATITPTLAADDLAALNSVHTSLLYIVNHMRADDVLPELPPEDGSGDEVGLDAPPEHRDVPQVSQVGSTLECTMGNWSGAPDSYTYAWTVGSNAYPAGPDANYAVQAADVGQTASCVVTATNEHGTGTAPASNSVTVA